MGGYANKEVSQKYHIFMSQYVILWYILSILENKKGKFLRFPSYSYLLKYQQLAVVPGAGLEPARAHHSRDFKYFVRVSYLLILLNLEEMQKVVLQKYYSIFYISHIENIIDCWFFYFFSCPVHLVIFFLNELI